MSQNYCHHINAAGVFCRGIPVKNRDYCYWHLHENGRRMKAARARARSQRVRIQMPVLDDLHAIQVGMMQMGEAILHGEIDHRSGRLLLALLRLAASNIKARHIWEQEAEMQDRDVTQYVCEDDGFEEQYDLPQDFDLSVEPEVAFPPPEEATADGPPIPGFEMCENGVLRPRLSQILRDAATPIPGTDFQATADTMELIEVYEREGEQAGLKRAVELERNRKRRERRERRMRYEEMARNRNIQLAAEKLVRDQQRHAGTAREAAIERDAAAEASRKPPQSNSNGSLAEATEVGAGAV